MKEKAKFLESLNGLLKMAKEQGSQISIDEVKCYFESEALTEEQMELVFDYLLSQKVVVKGYVKMDVEDEKEALTEEEQAYLKEYMRDLEAFPSLDDVEKRGLYEKAITGDTLAKQKLIEQYLKEVVEIAKELRAPEVFLGDLIQEGNLGLMLGVEEMKDTETAHDIILQRVRESMQALLKEQEDLSSRDKKMVEKVQMLDDSINALTEELGRKVSIDELALYMGLEIEEIEDILKLTGEEVETEEEEA